MDTDNEIELGGRGYTTPAVLTLRLLANGEIAVENHGAAATWCQRHGKYLRIVFGDTASSTDAPIVDAGRQPEGHADWMRDLFKDAKSFDDVTPGECYVDHAVLVEANRRVDELLGEGGA